MSNVDTVRGVYEAFGRGDVAAILAKLASDVEWEYGVNSTDVPWLQPRRGRDQVAGFFQSLAAIDFHAFQPTALLESGPLVVSLVTFEGTVRATGRRLVEVDEVHIWRFSGDGQVTQFRHRADTHQQWTAFHGS